MPASLSLQSPQIKKVAPVFLALLVFIVFGQALSYDLVWDDTILLEYVTETVSATGVGGLLASEFAVSQSNGYFRPVVLFSLWVDSLVGGDWFFHLTNVLLHAANTVLLFFAARRLVRFEAALAGALVFALHPVHVESVVFVSGRTDLWSAFFSLGAFLLLVSPPGSGGRSGARYLLMGLSLLLGCLSKETAFSFPFIAALFCLGSFKGSTSRDLKKWFLPLGVCLGAVVVALLLRYLAMGALVKAGGAVVSPGGPGFAEKLAFYLRLTFLPWPLKAYYENSDVVLSAPVVFSALCFGVVWFLSFLGERKTSLLGAAWMFVFLLPVLVADLSAAPVADRFLYVPSIGFSFLVAAALNRDPGRFRGFSRAVLATLLAAMCAVLLLRTQVWSDEKVLYSTIVEESPGWPVAHYNMGYIHQQEGAYGKALEEYFVAKSLDPGYWKTHKNMAFVYGKQGDWAKALESLMVVERIKPDEPSLPYNLGTAHANLGNWEKSARYFERALGADGTNPALLNNLGFVLGKKGSWVRAVEVLKRAVSLSPGDANARYNLAEAYFKAGQRTLAQGELAVLRRLSPEKARLLEELLGE